MFSKKEIKSIYNFLNNTIPIIDFVSSNNYLHNKVRVKYLGEKSNLQTKGENLEELFYIKKRIPF